MRGHVLVTGGAGFIGSHVARELLARGYAVRAFDALQEQVHGGAERPEYLMEDVELAVGDIRDREAVARALDGIDIVVHFAARVGVGQSMYEIADYTSVNGYGTAVLLEAMMDRPIRKLLVASSMSVYGEGLYVAAEGPVEAVERSRAQLERGDWQPRGPGGEQLRPVATPETKRPALSSVYALSKYDQERMCLMFGSSYGVPTVALRFFNVYGPHQALSNPYTGVLAIFAGRLLNGRPPLIFEDGEQRRDFVNVDDVARACVLALDADGADGMVVNVGSGESVTVSEIANRLARVLGCEHIASGITGKYRVGDVRHCFADTSLAERTLGYRSTVSLEEGILRLAGWLEGQVAHDRVDNATAELAERGLTL
ncbi:MAG TPA: SDR family NAD(P)-dependent oxidoreductase [Thermoleophilaceae bacterium]|nr:SDR family NAD(P)-dependent oxidoreductase [Thermoleophilaceae bacterium]